MTPGGLLDCLVAAGQQQVRGLAGSPASRGRNCSEATWAPTRPSPAHTYPQTLRSPSHCALWFFFIALMLPSYEFSRCFLNTYYVPHASDTAQLVPSTIREVDPHCVITHSLQKGS